MANVPPLLNQPFNPNPQEPPRVARRTWIIWVAVVAGILLLVLFKDRMEPKGEIISQYQFEQLVDSNRIVHATVKYDPQNPLLNEVAGKYYQVQDDGRVEVAFLAKVRLTDELERKLLSLPQFEPRESSSVLLNVLYSVLPIIIIAVLIWFFFIRQIRLATKGAPTQAELHAKAAEQQERFDRILSKWEEQAQRMDALLNKRERDDGR